MLAIHLRSDDPPANQKGLNIDTAQIANQTTGAQHVTVQPSMAGMPWHIHEFDQIYFNLSGTLTVEITGERYEAGPRDLMVLPAGVPHLSLPVPEPEATPIFDHGVDFEHNGSNI